MAPTPMPPQDESRLDAARRVLLLVDNDPLLVESIQAMVHARQPQMSVLGARNATEALRIFHSRQVDLVVAEFRLPGTNGLDLLARLRAEAPSVPRIVLTSLSDVSQVLGGIDACDAAYFFRHPVDPTKLMGAIEELTRDPSPALPPDRGIHWPPSTESPRRPEMTADALA